MLLYIYICVLGCTCYWDVQAHSLQEVVKRYAYLILHDDPMMMMSMMERGSYKNPDDFEVYINDWMMTLLPYEGMKFCKIEALQWYDDAKEKACGSRRIKLLISLS